VQIARLRRAERRLRSIPGYNDNTYAFAHIDNPDLFCGLVTDAKIIPGSMMVCTDDGFLIRQQLAQSDEIPALSKESFFRGKDPQGRYSIAPPAATETIGRPCIFIGGLPNFGHMIVESVMRLLVLDFVSDLKELPIVVYNDLPSRFYDLFDLMGYPRDRRIEIARDTVPNFMQVWLVSAPMHRAHIGSNPQLWPDGVWALRTHVAHLFRPLPAQRPRFYIPRGPAKWRRLINEDSNETLELFREYRVSPLLLHELTVPEQIAAVSNAELIIAAQGAGAQITNFAPPDCAVVEIASPNLGAILGPQGTALILDQPYARLHGRLAEPEEVAAAGLEPNPSARSEDRDLAFDVEKLRTILQAAHAYCNR